MAANHSSFIDPLLIGSVAPRPVRFLITESWYARSALWRFLFDGCGVIPTATLTPARTIVAVARAALAGALVCVFPEGLISDDGRLRRFRHGIGWMAALTGVPVYPCALVGSYRSLPRQRRWPRLVPIDVALGPPVRFPGAPCPAPDLPAVGAFVDQLARTVCALAGQDDRLEAARPKPRPVDLRAEIAQLLRNDPLFAESMRDRPKRAAKRET